jgi:uncharacterized protein (TIGR02117 family)
MRRWLRRLGAAAGLAVALYLAASLILPLVPGPRASMSDAGTPVRLGLLAGPIHYDFLVPLTPEVRQRFAFARPAGLAVDDPGAEWLILGRGGRAFYTTVGTYADLSAGAVWLGVTGDATVMRLDVVGPVRVDAGIRWLELSPAGFAGFLDAVLAGFAPGPEGAPVALAVPGLSARDVFFASPGRTDIFRTCNVWVGRMLRASGQRFGLWTPATWSVRLSLWRFAG